MLYFALIAFLIFALFFGGIPVLVRIASFFSDINSSGSLSGELDTVPPATPRFNFPSEATNQNPITIKGFAESGSKIIFFLDDSENKQVITGEDGTFLADNLKLHEGINRLYVVAVDSAGNESQPSGTMQISYDITPPTLEISEPTNNSTLSSANQKKIFLKGKTDQNALLKINDVLVFLSGDGSFSSSFTLNEGENLIKIEAADLAGNKTEKELKITFVP